MNLIHWTWFGSCEVQVWTRPLFTSNHRQPKFMSLESEQWLITSGMRTFECKQYMGYRQPLRIQTLYKTLYGEWNIVDSKLWIMLNFNLHPLKWIKLTHLWCILMTVFGGNFTILGIFEPLLFPSYDVLGREYQWYQFNSGESKMWQNYNDRQ